jgi:hypothetical protein
MGYFNTLYKLSHRNVGSKGFPDLSSVGLARPMTSEPWSFPPKYVNQRMILCWIGTQNKPQTTTDGAGWTYLDQQLHQ